MSRVQLVVGEYLVTQGRRVVMIILADSVKAATAQFIQQFPTGAASGDYMLWARIKMEAIPDADLQGIA